MSDTTDSCNSTTADEEFFEAHHDTYTDWLRVLHHNDVVTLSDGLS